MKNLIFFDDAEREHLLPFTYSRPISELRFGILRLREKWERDLGGKGSFITQEYLSKKYPIDISNDNIVINGSVLPNKRLVKLISELDFNEALLHKEELIAARLNQQQFENLKGNQPIEELIGFELTTTPVSRLARLPDLITNQEKEFLRDFERLTTDRKSQPIPPGNQVIAAENVFLEKGVEISNCVINASTGPVYIGEGSIIMEGTTIRGPFSLGRGCVVKMGTRIYGPVSAGPYCKLGGELNNVTMVAYSNKTHDGFLGHSYLGEWCNFGAGTNNSNLKNTYSNVRLWDYPSKEAIDTGLLFCGLFMADHTKCGINTTFNTGTVVGFASNLVGPIVHPRYVPSFSWGGGSSWETHKLEGAMKTAEAVMGRREVALTDLDKEIFKEIFKQSSAFRMWESQNPEKD